jgi:hypothetical protein
VPIVLQCLTLLRHRQELALRLLIVVFQVRDYLFRVLNLLLRLLQLLLYRLLKAGEANIVK